MLWEIRQDCKSVRDLSRVILSFFPKRFFKRLKGTALSELRRTSQLPHSLVHFLNVPALQLSKIKEDHIANFELGLFTFLDLVDLNVNDMIFVELQSEVETLLEEK